MQGRHADTETGRQAESEACDYWVSPETVDRQYAACRLEVLFGPQKMMRWGVPDGTRDEHGSLVHDDFVLADSLTAVLDRLEWSIHSSALVIPARDPLDDMSRTRPPEF